MIRLVHREFDFQSAMAVLRVLESGWVTMGSITDKLEKTLMETTKTEYAIATNSCSSALYISLRACVEQGKRVVLSPFTFASAMHAVVLAGAIPVFIDIDPWSGNISPSSLTDMVLEKADAILVSHYAGIPCSEEVLIKAREYGLIVIDDSAHALGATRRDGTPIQTEADVACLSFNSTKMFSSGEGGAIVTNEASIAEKCRLLRNYGMTKTSAQKAIEGPSFDIREISLNFKFNDILAAVLIPQLAKTKMVDVLNQRALMAETYRLRMENSEFEMLNESVGDKPSWLFFPILLPSRFKSRRLGIVHFLRDRGVETSILFPDLTTIAMNLGVNFYDYGHPLALDASERIMTLPCHESMTERDVEYIVGQLENATHR